MIPTERDSPSTDPHHDDRGDGTAAEATKVSTAGPLESTHVARFRASLAWALDEYAETLAKLAK